MTATATTAQAATTAGVTIATIRTWCRVGAVAATKVARRWVIDTASLARRIAIAAARRRPRPVAFTTETMVRIGGHRWTKAGHDRVYLNHWAELAGIETSHYGTGSIASATYKGERISNSEARRLLGAIQKVWFDAADGKLHVRLGWTDARTATREQVWDDVVAGVRAAIAAL